MTTYYKHNNLKEIISYSYSLCNDGTLEIFAIFPDGKEKCVLTISECSGLEDYELDNLVQKTLEENGYIIL